MASVRNDAVLRILQVNSSDSGGGAELVARSLLDAANRTDSDCWMAVGRKQTSDPRVYVIPNDRERNPWARLWLAAGNQFRPFEDRPGFWTLRRALAAVGDPPRALNEWRGREDFSFPGTWRLFDFRQQKPDIVHCHNLHGRFFDLRALPWLARTCPVVVTLHDAWLLTGHCAHSFECDRWERGCGHCPDLDIYPAVMRDATAENWIRKRDIYHKMRLHVATPSSWLMSRVDRSILSDALGERRVIPNGVRLDVFTPGDRAQSRRRIGLPEDRTIVLSVGSAMSTNPWKDYPTLRNAIGRLASTRKHLIWIVLGDSKPPVPMDGVDVRHVAFQDQPRLVADYYRACDLYVHAAHVDTFPTTVLEAMATGTPIVATDIGGIPEQIEHEVTGLLVEGQQPAALAHAARMVLDDPGLGTTLGSRAATAARRRFDLNRQVRQYLDWYREIVESRPHA